MTDKTRAIGCCGDCYFHEPLAGDDVNVECRYGPVGAQLVPVRADLDAMPPGQLPPDQRMMQKMTFFPAPPKDWWCHRYRPEDGE